MDDNDAFSGSVLRVFEARTRPGCTEMLLEKFATTSIDVIRGRPGNQGHLIGKQVSADGNTVVFISIWESMSAIKSRFGAEWQSSHLPTGYDALIEDCSLQHIVLERDWPFDTKS